MGLEGFTGNESILYHLQSPCRVMELGGFEPIEREEWVPEQHAHLHFKTFDIEPDGRRDHRPPPPDVEQRRRDLALPPVRLDGLLLPQRRGRRGDLRPRGLRHARDDLRRPARTREGDYVVVPRGTTYRFKPEGAAALPRVRDAGADRDPAPLPQPVRADHRGRAVLPPRHPSADRAAHGARARRVPGQGARARRLPDVRRRLPPVRRRRLGRLPLSVDVLDPRLRADHRPHPPAAAVAPDVPGPELRDLLVLPAQARLRPATRCRSRTTTRTCSRRR